MTNANADSSGHDRPTGEVTATSDEIELGNGGHGSITVTCEDGTQAVIQPGQSAVIELNPLTQRFARVLEQPGAYEPHWLPSEGKTRRT